MAMCVYTRELTVRQMSSLLVSMVGSGVVGPSMREMFGSYWAGRLWNVRWKQWKLAIINAYSTHFVKSYGLNAKSKFLFSWQSPTKKAYQVLSNKPCQSLLAWRIKAFCLPDLEIRALPSHAIQSGGIAGLLACAQLHKGKMFALQVWRRADYIILDCVRQGAFVSSICNIAVPLTCVCKFIHVQFKQNAMHCSRTPGL